jgi:hypothetical protein
MELINVLQLSLFVVKCCFSVCKEEEEEDAGRKSVLKGRFGVCSIYVWSVQALVCREKHL